MKVTHESYIGFWVKVTHESYIDFWTKVTYESYESYIDLKVTHGSYILKSILRAYKALLRRFICHLIVLYRDNKKTP